MIDKIIEILILFFGGAFFPLLMWWINTESFNETRSNRIFACTALTTVSVAFGAIALKEEYSSFLAYLIGAALSYHVFFHKVIK